MNDKRFASHFEDRVKSTISEHNLLEQDDRVIVAVSGGKDSTTALYILKKLGYCVEAMIIDQLLGEYSRKNLENIKAFCDDNGIKLHIVRMRDEYGYSVCYMESLLEEKGINLNMCTICGVIRRSVLNRKAREINATKIATGHNLDDEAQTFFMNMLHGNIQQSARLGPRTGFAEDRKFIPRIKPLYFCPEFETERYSRLKNFPVVYEPCPCSAGSFRSHVKEALNGLEKENPGTKLSIVESFLDVLPSIRQNMSEGAIDECTVCGEPSSGRVCRVCSIINEFKAETLS